MFIIFGPLCLSKALSSFLFIDFPFVADPWTSMRESEWLTHAKIDREEIAVRSVCVCCARRAFNKQELLGVEGLLVYFVPLEFVLCMSGFSAVGHARHAGVCLVPHAKMFAVLHMYIWLFNGDMFTSTRRYLSPQKIE